MSAISLTSHDAAMGVPASWRDAFGPRQREMAGEAFVGESGGDVVEPRGRNHEDTPAQQARRRTERHRSRVEQGRDLFDPANPRRNFAVRYVAEELQRHVPLVRPRPAHGRVVCPGERIDDGARRVVGPHANEQSRHTHIVGDRIIVVLPDDASDDDRRAAKDLGADVVITTSELVREMGEIRRVREPDPDASAFLASLTKAESRVLTELAHRPDTRSRLANRLGVTASTLDNHLAAIKRKLLDHLVTSGNTPLDGYLSIEAVIGWASRHMPDQKT